MQIGGQLTITTDVENYPGYPEGISGPAMMEDFLKQASRFGADIRWGSITEVDFSQRPFIIKADDGKTILAETVIIATGASARWLGPGIRNKVCRSWSFSLRHMRWVFL